MRPFAALASQTCSSGLVDASSRNGSPMVSVSAAKMVLTGWV